MFWKIYQIYDALTSCIKDKRLNNSKYANGLTGKYGHFYYNKIDNNVCNFDEKLYKMYYKQLILSKTDELREFAEEVTNRELNNYIQHLIYYIPQSILSKIADIRVFALGVMTKEIYNEIMNFIDELKNWLIKPTATSKIFNLEEVFIIAFHDNFFNIYKRDNKLKLNNLLFDNCKAIILNYRQDYIQNDYLKNEDYRYENIEGYNYM